MGFHWRSIDPLVLNKNPIIQNDITCSDTRLLISPIVLSPEVFVDEFKEKYGEALNLNLSALFGLNKHDNWIVECQGGIGFTNKLADDVASDIVNYYDVFVFFHVV